MKYSNEEKKYFDENKDGIVMFYDSIDEYITSRFLLGNGFLKEGLIFGCQAIEKILKSFILLTKGNSYHSHNPFDLKETLKVTSNLNLDKYDSLLKRLFNNFQSRYSDNNFVSNIRASSEVFEIDELYIFLLEKLPLISEFKFGSSFFQYLFIYPTCNYGEALLMNNDLLKNKISEFKKGWESIK